MRLQSIGWTLCLTMWLVAAGQAQEELCPAGLPERPALSQHIEQADILDGTLSFEEVFDHGDELFTVLFNVCDGQGRPATTGGEVARQPDEPAFSRVSAPDSNSCASCHIQPREGGSGEFAANVFLLAQHADPTLETTSQMFSNHRNPLGMFGSGPIEMLAREMSTDLWELRDSALAEARAEQTAVTVDLITKGVSFGVLVAEPDGTLDTSGVKGVDADLVIKPFHQSGTKVSLRQFSANSMNQHHGMQAEERFDLNPAIGVPDFDQDGVERELTIGDITALTIYQAALATPGRVMPEDPARRAAAIRGEQVFAAIGCTSCHIPELRLESRFYTDPNPFNSPDTMRDMTQTVRFDMTVQGEHPRLERSGEGAIVRAFTDLKRHTLCDPMDQPDAIRFFCNEQLLDSRPDQDGRSGTEFFLTRKLWDAGSSPPYGHRGDLTTLSEAILMHGGEARATRDAFVALDFADQQALVEFLLSLQVLPEEEVERVATASGESVPVSTAIAISGLLVCGSLGGMWFWRRQQHRAEEASRS
ncbi:MAG: hypothetical protein OXF22_06310 [Anaerolineaceae bacterium]|nr:hypothetical protein [Anaerolineaceae bacterium]